MWYRQHYRLAPTDPRYLDTCEEQMIDELYAFGAYQRLLKGEADELDIDSGQTEDELMEELERLEQGEGWEPLAAAPTEEELARELEQYQ